MQNRFEISGLADVQNQTRLQMELWNVTSTLMSNVAKSKMIEEGWLPKTTQVDINLTSVDNQRSVTSLCTTLLRRVLKSTPYIEHLVNYQTEKLISSRQGNMVVQGYVYSERAVLQLDRYLRHLNYLLRKNKLPFEFDRVRSTDVEGMSMKKVTFICQLVVRYPLSKTETLSSKILLTEKTLEERFQEIEKRAQAAYGNPDAAYTERCSGHSEWGLVTVSAVVQGQYNALRVGRDTNYSLNVPERIFLMLPHVLKFVENLTRKLVYGPSAFTVVAKDDALRNAQSAVSTGDSELPTSPI